MKRYFIVSTTEMQQNDFSHLGEYHYINNTDGTSVVVLFNCNHPPSHWQELPHLLDGGFKKAKEFAKIHPKFEP